MSSNLIVPRRLDAPPERDRLYVLAALTRDKGHYRFVIRWLLGASDEPNDQANDLPRADDFFEVCVRRLSGDYLQADGGWAPDRHVFRKHPMPFAMIDPPRVEDDMPGYGPGAGKRWLLAQKPLAPVDAAVPNDSLRTPDGSKAMGVVHLLAHSDRTAVAHKIARVFARAIFTADASRALGHRFETMAARIGLDFAAQVDAAALRLAEQVMVGRARPWQVVNRISRQVESLSKEISQAGMTPDAPQFAARWFNAALLASLVTNRAALAEATELGDEAERVRSQLRLRCLQGGRMIDFWADGPSSTPNESDRGKQWTAADLFGLGMELGEFSKEEVEQWLALPNGSKDGVHIEVRHAPAMTAQAVTPSPSATLVTSDPPARHLYAEAVLDYREGDTLLSPADIRTALDKGSSTPPPPPPDAFVNYDLVRKWLDPDKAPSDAESPVAYGTGDGRVEILIRKPEPEAPDGTKNNVMGFNVYGVWEGASLTTDSWFQGTEPKCLDELKPWLITRRYSWLRDLQGALPPVAGAPHDNLLAELDDPAWHPIMVRASTIEDRSSDAPSVSSDRKLPNAIRPGLTIWSFDLRQGMGSGVHSMRRGWDPSAPIVTSWTPYHWRHDDLTSGSVRPVPQRYRFWVTCVDALDQESPPIAVRTADAAAGEEVETHIFTPRHRTPLPSPPQHEEHSPRAIKISADADRRRIEVRFSVPDRFHLGSQDVEGTTPGLIDPSTLLAKVVLVRRQLVARINTERFELLSHDDPVLGSPPWQHSLEELGKEGWVRFPPAIEVVPQPDGTCVAHFTLDHVDRGFEYRAVIGFAIARDLMHFWYPPVRTRVVHGTKKSGNGEFEAAPPELIFEAPAIGGIAQTAVLPLPNRAPPRDASSAASAMHWAKPVLPPPGVNRDRVLMRLLSNPVASAPPKEAPEPPSLAAWLAEGLNLAQAHMAHAAMARVAFDSANAPSEGQWDMLRRWIAHDLKEPSTGLRQHGLVGFRGLMALDWNYTPVAKQRPAAPAQPGDDSEAEATLFRIYAARAPSDARGASKPDLEVVVQNATGDLCRTNPIVLDPILARLLKSGFQPALVVIRRNTTELAYATAHDFRGSAENQIDTIVLRPLPADGALPPLDGATCLIYLAALAADVKNEHFGSEPDAMRCYVPVGGGPKEAIAWWVAAVSAQEVLSPANGWPVHFHSFPASIQLPAPAAPVARSVVNSSEPWLAADAVPAHWRPAKLTDATAPYEARTFVTWDKSDFPADTWIEIDRVSRGLGETMRALAEPEVFEEWKAIKLIEATDDGAPLDPVWIERVARQWLLGFAVEPDPTDPLPPPPYVAFPARELKPESGLALVDPQPADPAAPPGSQDKRRPALVDYFAKDNVSLMESDTEYRYRVRIVQDVAPDAPKEWRYLRSEWSGFSSWVLPVRPQLDVREATPIIRSIGLRPPAVEFHLRADEHSGKDTRYRVTLQRKVRAALLATEETSASGFIAWRDVGAIVELEPGTGGTTILRDDELERLDAFEPLTVEYRMRVLHYALVDGGERLLRKAPKDPIVFAFAIPAPPDQSLQERMLVQEVTLA